MKTILVTQRSQQGDATFDSHDALGRETVVECENCGAEKLPHHICKSCGYYKKRQVFEIRKVEDKKE